MKTIAFYRSGISGGTGTFAVRLAKEMIGRGYSVYYFYSIINDTGNYDYLSSIGVKMINQKDIKKSVHDDELRLVITYTVEEHANAVRYFREYDRIRIVLYTVSNAVTGALFHNYHFLNTIETFLSKKYIHNLYYNNQIWFTSPFQEGKYKKHYHIVKNRTNPEYFMIPIDIHEFNEQELYMRFFNKERIILSVLRADFPLRGYIFGLIDDFMQLSKIYGNIKLKIISFGDEISKLTSYIAEHGNKRIEFINGCNYFELGNYINESFVNIGHGTCVLDASSRGVPSIVAVQNTYKNTTVGYFSQAKTITGIDTRVKGTFVDFCINLLDTSFEQYREISYSDYMFTVEKYSIVSFADKVESYIQKTDCDVRNNGLKRILFKDYLDRNIRAIYQKIHIRPK